jgi:IMP dehydrogenase/GMP reductase
MRKEYTYNDISLFSREISDIRSRFSDEIKLTNKIKFGNNYIDAGFLMSAPMYDVTGFDLSIKLLEYNQIPIVHRFMSSSEQLKLFMDTIRYFEYSKNKIYSYSVGINDCEEKITYLSNYLDTIKEERNNINILICIDTANGANRLLEKPVEIINNFKNKYIDVNIEILSGNIVTEEASEYLYNLGIKFQRISISTGSACSTSVVTGIYRPPVSAIMEISDYKERNNLTDLYLIADGGFKETSDMIKAIAIGADFIMSGNLFAGYKESNSPLLKYKDDRYEKVNEKTPSEYYQNILNTTGSLRLYVNNTTYLSSEYYEFYKYYRGMASSDMANLNNKVNNLNKNILAEGVSSFIKYKENLDGDLNNILNSFKSSMSYCNAHNFDEFRENIQIVEITNNSLIQRRPHV